MTDEVSIANEEEEAREKKSDLTDAITVHVSFTFRMRNVYFMWLVMLHVMLDCNAF